MKYSKQAVTIKDQIAQLESRGLIISDDAAATQALENVSYYRLAGYWWPMQADKARHTFKPNSNFEDVLAI